MEDPFLEKSEDKNTQQAKRIKIGNLYAHRTKKDGIPFLSGKLGWGTQIQVWPNKKRPGEAGAKDADYNIFICEVDEQNRPSNTTTKSNINPTPIADFPKNDEVPF